MTAAFVVLQSTLDHLTLIEVPDLDDFSMSRLITELPKSVQGCHNHGYVLIPHNNWMHCVGYLPPYAMGLHGSIRYHMTDPREKTDEITLIFKKINQYIGNEEFEPPNRLRWWTFNDPSSGSETPPAKYQRVA